MVRTTFTQAFLIGLLAALASFCALKASAEQAAARAYSVVAQSNKSTAATGRRPLSQRIAASNLPMLIPVGDGCSEHGCPVPGLDANPLLEDKLSPVMTPIAEGSPEEEAPESAEESPHARAEPQEKPDQHRGTSTVAGADRQRKSGASVKPLHYDQGSLLERVKNALTKKQQPDSGDTFPPHLIPKPIPLPVSETPANTTAADNAAAETSAVDPSAVAESMTVAESIAVTPIDDAPPADGGNIPPAPGDTNPLAGVPARLEFDVRESRSRLNEGEQVVVRIAVRNVGGEPANEVNATLFFAEGMEPVQAIGHAAEVYPGEVRFGTVRSIPPGDSVDLLVTAIGTRAGSVTYRGELQCSQLGGRIAREGAVTVRPRKALAE